MEVYKHDYSGSCAPGQEVASWQKTFSVGIFQWLPKSSGKRLKKSAVKFRITGSISNPDAVYRQAQRICDAMDNGIFPKKKSMILRELKEEINGK